MGATRAFIWACWAAWALYWLLMAFRAKRTIERGGFIGYRLVAVAALLVCLAIGRLAQLSARSTLWHAGLALGVVSDLLVLGGVAFTVWARVTLAGNWSAEVTFKQDHELIETGPYALVRHPIYTGLLLMGLGTLLSYGRAIGLAVFVCVCAAFWWKAREEERMMSIHFPAAYASYRRRVHAVIPYLL